MVKFIHLTLCEMCPNTEFFLVRIFPHSDWIRRDIITFTSYLSAFNPNAGKYGPEKTPNLDTFYAVLFSRKEKFNKCYVKVCILESFWKLYKIINKSIPCYVCFRRFYSKSTQRALQGHSSHSGIQRALRHSGTRRALGHSRHFIQQTRYIIIAQTSV